MKVAISLSKEEYELGKKRVEELGWNNKSDLEERMDQNLRDFISHMLEGKLGTVDELYILYDGYHLKPKNWLKTVSSEERSKTK